MTSGEKGIVVIALVLAISVGGYALYVSMDNNKRLEPTTDRTPPVGGLRNENVDIVVRETPVQSSEPSEFIRWMNRLSPAYQSHIRSLDIDTKQWLQGLTVEDRMSYMRRSVRSTGIEGNVNVDTGLST